MDTTPASSPSPEPALITWQDGQPFSPRYDDRYHTLSGARAQAEHVFLGGCGLPGAWHAARKDMPKPTDTPKAPNTPKAPDIPGAPGQPSRHQAPQHEPQHEPLHEPHHATTWTILETGFGLGLNFLSTWAAWNRACAPGNPDNPDNPDDPDNPDNPDDLVNPDDRARFPEPPAPSCPHASPSPCLRFVSTEAHPVRAEDIRRAAADDPVLEPLAARLAEAWPDDAASLPFVHLRLALPGKASHGNDTSHGNGTSHDSGASHGHPHGNPAEEASTRDEPAHGELELLILLGDTTQALDAWYRQHGSLEADSIFLDGFDPRKNPAMWSETTLRAIARHGRPGTRIATWCVARSVRDALTTAGFRWQKRAGLPPKRHCLTGVLGPSPAERPVHPGRPEV